MNNELHDWYVQHGICPRCGRENAAPNRKHCFNCLEKSAERSLERYHSMASEQKQLHLKKICERQHKQYEERKAAGKCVQCGKKPALQGRVRCTECLLMHRRKDEEYRRKNGAIPQTLLGDGYHCSTCGAATIKNKKLCDRCYKNAVRATKIMNARRCERKKQDFVFGKVERKAGT